MQQPSTQTASNKTPVMVEGEILHFIVKPWVPLSITTHTGAHGAVKLRT